MAKIITFKPLGEVLQDAGLVTPSQVQVALYDRQYYQDLRIGEILALRGWIEQETADFFVEKWFNLINAKQRQYPLGFYLKEAGILTEKEVKLVLKEQKQKQLRFGRTAVESGLIKQKTLDFFLNNLFPFEALNFNDSTVKQAEIQPENLENRVTREDINYWAKLTIHNLSVK